MTKLRELKIPLLLETALLFQAEDSQGKQKGTTQDWIMKELPSLCREVQDFTSEWQGLF